MNVNFVSDFKGLTIIYNPDPEPNIKLDGVNYSAGSIIAGFNPYRTTDASRNQIVEKGYLILDAEKDKERIEFLKKYPVYGKAYRIVANLPLNTMDNGSIVTGAVQPGQTLDIKQITQSIIAKTNTMKDLERKLFKEENGSLVEKVKVDEAELNQYNELKKELGL